jgi:NAD(P)-dependent dehydrogenase (short-subunit alcohol dehydrogenase family)
MTRSVLIVGGTAGIGLSLARFFAGVGDEVVVTGRDAERAEEIAKEIGGSEAGSVRGLGFDLAEPESIASALAGVERVDHLVLAAIERDQNTIAEYDIARARRLITLKLVGYTEVVHTIAPRMGGDGSIVVFGGLAKDRPYVGSTTVSTVNGGVIGLVHSLVVELAPIRVNAVHPGIVGDSPFWSAKPPGVLDGYISRTPLGRLAAMQDVVDAVVFLLRNQAVNGVNLPVDGGWLLT